MNTTLNLNEKLQVRMLTMLARINFISWSTLVIGIGVMLAAGFLYSISQDDQDFQVEVIMSGAGLAVAVIGFWMVRQVRALRKSSLDLSEIDKKLTLLTISALLVGAIIAAPLLYLAPIWGIGVAFVFGALLLDMMRLRALAWRTKNDPEQIITSKSIFKKIKILIYPKINHGNHWHRLITVVGWIVSIFSWFILFPIYFGIVQRIIYFVIYGDKKEKWLIQE